MYRHAWTRWSLVAVLFTIACAKTPSVDGASTARAALFANGNFEGDAIGAVPASWTIEKYLNPGLAVVPPTNFAQLALTTDGGGLNVSVVGGATETVADPQLGSGAGITFRYPKYGQRSVVVNPGNANVPPTDTSPTGRNRSANAMRQTMTIGANDVDPLDGKFHVRFVAAPVLENPTHTPDQQPYFFIQVRNLTRGVVLYSNFNFAGQAGVAWKAVGSGLLYTDWQLVDVPMSGVQLNDQLEMVVVAAGCSLGGHAGHVYLDSFGPTVPGLYLVGSAPAAVPQGSTLTYTLDYRNSSGAATAGTTVSFVTPPNTTYQANTGACTGGVVGSASTLSCPIGTLADGAHGTFTVTVNVNNGTAGTTITQQNYSIQATGVNALLGSKLDTLVYAGPATITAFSGTPQSATVNTDYGSTLVAEVRDATNAVIPGIQVSWAVPSSGASGTLPIGVSTTDAAGHASMTVHANTVAGAFLATAALPGVATPANFALTNTAGAPATITVVSGTPQNATVGAAFAAPLVVRVTDSFGNPVAGAAVTFTAPATGARATLTSPAVTNASGQTQVTATAGTVAGAFAVTASAAGVSTPASFALTNTAGAVASISVVSGTPQSATVGAAFAAPLIVKVADAFGNGISGATLTFSAPATGALATLTSPAVTNASGQTQVTATAGTVAGTYAVTASTTGVTTPVSFALTNTAGAPATITVVSGTPQNATVGAAFAAPLVVRVTDSFGNPVAGAAVTFTAPGTGARATLTSPAVTNASGQTQVTATAGTVAGAFAVTASAAGVSTPASFALTNTAGAVASISVVSGTPQSATVGAAFAAPLIVKVADAFGNGISGATVTFSAPATGARATLTSPAVTNASGQTQVTATAGTVAGTYAVTASTTGVTTPVSFALTNTAGAPATITVVSGGAQATPHGQAFPQPLVVVVKDASGNVVPNATVKVTAPGSGASASTTGSLTTNAQGQVSLSATANQTVGGPYDVSLSVTGVGTAAVFHLTNTVGAPAHLTLVSGGGQQAGVTTSYASPVLFTVTDATNAPVPGVSVTFSAPATGPSVSLGSTSAITDAAGLVSVSLLANTVAGDLLVTAASAGLTSATAPEHNRPGDAASVTVVSGSGQTTQVGTAFGKPLVVQVVDAWGNPVPGASLAWTTPTTGASAGLDTTSSTTDAQGQAQVQATANGTGGAYAVSVALPSGQHATFTLTNVDAAALVLTVVSGTPQAAPVTTAYGAPLVVSVTRGSMPVADVLVTFQAPTSGPSATLSASTARTDAAGHAQVTATASARAGTFSVRTAAVGAGADVTFALTNQPGPAVALVADPGSTPQTAQSGTAFHTPLGATVVDAQGNPVPGVAVTVTAPSTGATATLGGTSPLTSDASGHVSMPATAGGTAGTYAVTMSAPGVATPASFTLTNATTGAKSIAVVSGSGQHTTVGTAFAAPLRVVVRDAGGARLPNETVSWVAHQGAGADATLSSGTSTTDANGEATIDATANTIAGRYPVLATVVDGAAPATFELLNAPGAPASLVALASASPQSTKVLTPFSLPLQVTVRDMYGNPVPGVTVTYTAPSAPAATATLVASPVVTNADGQASVNAIASAKAGSYEVNASVAGVTAPAAFSLTNLPGDPVTVVVVAGGTQSAPVGSSYGTPVVVQVVDAQGNPVPGAPVSLQLPTSGASATASPSPATTGSDGRVTIVLTANNTPGSFEVPVSTSGGATPAVLHLDNTIIPTTTTVSSPGGHVGQPVVLTATVSSASGTPEGTVHFWVDGQEVGQGTLAGGTATLSVPGLSEGTHQVSATYDAQGPYGASQATAASVAVTKDDGSLNGGGGCSCDSGGGLFALAAVLVPAARRRRRARAGRRALGGAMVAALALVAVPARAQTSSNAVALNVFHDASAGSEWFGIDGADLRGHLRPAVRVLFDFAHNPLVIYNADGSKRAIAIANQAWFNVAGSLVLWDRVRFNLDLPIAVHSGGFHQTFNEVSLQPAAQAGLGDLALGADVRLFGRFGGFVTGALGVQVTLPTGNASAFFGDGHVGVTPRFAVSGDLSLFAWSAQLAYAVRTATLAGVAYGNELRFGAAAGVRLVERKLLVGPELHGFGPLGGVGTPARNAALEVDLGAHYQLHPDWRVSAGVGTGLMRSSGVPDYRLLAAVEWQPHVDDAPAGPADRDRDGIPDATDACPDVAGPASSDPALTGCPDRDGDGVPDGKDRCPEVAQGPHPDPKLVGCPLLDSDGDGVFDVDDVCPVEPMGPAPDPLRKGCPLPPDSDGDGVVDADDRCPTVPKGPRPDPARPGCPLADRDGDSIPDATDACPDQPGAPSAEPKQNGCPGLVLLEGSKILILEQVRFATDKDVILPSSNQVLSAVAQTMKSFPELKRVSIDGHTDSQGGAAYNKDLSDRRAKSVLRWLVAHGIEADRLEAHGHGQEQPIETNATPDGRAKNRRVEFRIVQRSE